jgi:tRNA(Ile)-lysidine synthase TilS/MesJ
MFLKLNESKFALTEDLFNQKIFSKNNLYLVAVSGGPDSMFCLENMRIRGYKIVVAHVNYQKRIESGYDESLVRDYCQRYSLPLEVRRVEKNEYLPSANFQD